MLNTSRATEDIMVNSCLHGASPAVLILPPPLAVTSPYANTTPKPKHRGFFP